MDTATNTDTTYLTTAEAAELIRHRPQTLRKWRVTGRGPAFIRLAGRVLYTPADLHAWLAAHRRQSTSDPGPAGSGSPS